MIQAGLESLRTLITIPIISWLRLRHRTVARLYQMLTTRWPLVYARVAWRSMVKLSLITSRRVCRKALWRMVTTLNACSLIIKESLSTASPWMGSRSRIPHLRYGRTIASIFQRETRRSESTRLRSSSSPTTSMTVKGSSTSKTRLMEQSISTPS